MIAAAICIINIHSADCAEKGSGDWQGQVSAKAADESLRLLRACGNIHEDMHKPVDKFEDGTFPCFSYMVY